MCAKNKKQPKKKSNLCIRYHTRCHRTPSGPSLRRWQSQWLRHLTIQTSTSLKPMKMLIGSPLPGQLPMPVMQKQQQPPVQQQQPPVQQQQQQQQQQPTMPTQPPVQQQQQQQPTMPTVSLHSHHHQNSELPGGDVHEEKETAEKEEQDPRHSQRSLRSPERPPLHLKRKILTPSAPSDAPPDHLRLARAARTSPERPPLHLKRKRSTPSTPSDAPPDHLLLARAARTLQSSTTAQKHNDWTCPTCGNVN